MNEESWHEDGVVCPFCKSENVEGVGWGSRLIALDDEIDYENWQCNQCGRKWER